MAREATTKVRETNFNLLAICGPEIRRRYLAGTGRNSLDRCFIQCHHTEIANSAPFEHRVLVQAACQHASWAGLDKPDYPLR
jgi:hypothetical protein